MWSSETCTSNPTFTLRWLGWQERHGRAHAVLSWCGSEACCLGEARGPVTPASRPTRMPKCSHCVAVVRRWGFRVGQRSHRRAEAA